MIGSRTLIGAVLATLIAPTLLSAQPSLAPTAEFVVPEAGQGVAVDARFFYAIDNTTIAKYEKKTGTLVKRWVRRSPARWSIWTAPSCGRASCTPRTRTIRGGR